METALIDRALFDQLPEYSSSIPTGTAIGKVWKRAVVLAAGFDAPITKWRLGQYYDIGDPEKVGIWWRDIEIVEPIDNGSRPEGGDSDV